VSASRTAVLTGFDAYGRFRTNPSAYVVKHLNYQTTNQADIIREVLPTSYERAAARVRNLIHRYNPDILVMFGHSAQATALRLERYAHNFTTSTRADNDGRRVKGPIDESGPSRLLATVDIDSLFESLKYEQPTSYISDDAGEYVCSYAYYVALMAIERAHLATRCLFVHLPTISTADQRRNLTRSANQLVTNLIATESCDATRAS
jgi:pyroglutamyl-peptidase